MQDVIPFDLHRMFLGDAPPLYFGEIVLRIVIIWTWTMLLLRWIGGRSISQLSLVEFLLVIALGSAVGDSLFLPDVPISHAFLVILVVVLIDKGIDLLIRRYDIVKRAIDGEPLEVVKDGKILTTNLTRHTISAPELMELLRLRGVENLGAVRRAYLEPSGQVSVFKSDQMRAGLPLVPPVEQQSKRRHPFANCCCANCGSAEVRVQDARSVCADCGQSHWAATVMSGTGTGNNSHDMPLDQRSHDRTAG
ncbi:DUF421 domain-containing protein [Ketogulonicigenium vulgare]|uniref:DUF421 domain-containing protein n=1 Tax=Ketogulonicigenium vulgare TaxID=92945 RepID=UPI0023589B38|nr:YetF domain-containing protein [Ketogulonicigenium vulgare]